MVKMTKQISAYYNTNLACVGGGTSPFSQILLNLLQGLPQRRRASGFRDPFLVPGAGLEPARYCYREILSLLRLPFRHPGNENILHLNMRLKTRI